MTGALAIVMGLAYVASPGPVNIETLRRGLAGGFRVALALQLGSLIGDLLWAILALAGAGLPLAHAWEWPSEDQWCFWGVSVAPLVQVARDHQIPLRTAQRWIAQYRMYKLAGLIRVPRADLDQHRAY